MKDILLTNNDLMVKDGDLAIGISDTQHVNLLLSTNKGDWKQTPTAGVGITNYLETHNDGSLSREIQTQLSADGAKISRIAVKLPNIEIESDYEN